MADKQGVSAEQFRKARTYTIEVDGMPFVLRRIDLATMFMEGMIPMPLMSAVDRLEAIRKRAMEEGPGVFAEINESDRKAMDELLRRCAAAVCQEPKVVWENPSETQLSVHELTTTQLVVIWKAVLKQTGVKITPDADADMFRPHEPAAADPDRGGGHGVRAEAVVVAVPASEPSAVDDVEWLPSR